jgi:hypothetical protein
MTPKSGKAADSFMEAQTTRSFFATNITVFIGSRAACMKSPGHLMNAHQRLLSTAMAKKSITLH